MGSPAPLWRFAKLSVAGARYSGAQHRDRVVTHCGDLRDGAIWRRLCVALAAFAALCCSRGLYAQFTEPRTYTVAPVGLNELELSYTHAHSDASIDTSLVVAGAHFELNAGTVTYTHDFSLLDHLAWAEVIVPYASLSGSVAGTSISKSKTGAGDLSLQLGGLLTGGRALNAAEFAKYQPATTSGMSLTVTAPTGEYDPNKLLNLGSNRWSFKPELALAHPFGDERASELDLYANVYFFTDNSSYRGVEILRQEPLPGLEAHLSHNFTSSFWASLDVRYSFRGGTVVDGLDQNNAQRDLTLGSEVNWEPGSHNSFQLVFATSVVHQNAPPYTGVAIRYTYSWGPG